jgi:hypothetical protein
LRASTAMSHTGQAIIGVVWRQEPDLVALLRKLLREGFRVTPDAARIRVRVGRHEGYAHAAHGIGHT